jgi:hypothetical protein
MLGAGAGFFSRRSSITLPPVRRGRGLLDQLLGACI